MSVQLTLAHDFRLFADYVLKKLGPHCTLRDAADFVEQTQSDKLAVACGVKDFGEILRVLAALKLVVSPLTPLAQLTAGQSTPKLIEPAVQAMPPWNLLAPPTQEAEYGNDPIRRWKQVHFALHIILVSLIVTVLLLFFTIVTWAGLTTWPGLNGGQRDLLTKALAAAGWLIALFLSFAFFGQVMCGAAPAAAGANSLILLSGIGYFVALLGLPIVYALLSKSSSPESVDSQRFIAYAKITIVGSSLTLFIAHGLFLMGLLRIMEHLGVKGMNDRVVAQMAFYSLLWSLLIFWAFWGGVSNQTRGTAAPSFENVDPAEPYGSPQQILCFSLFISGLLVSCVTYIWIIKQASDAVSVALQDMNAASANER